MCRCCTDSEPDAHAEFLCVCTDYANIMQVQSLMHMQNSCVCAQTMLTLCRFRAWCTCRFCVCAQTMQFFLQIQSLMYTCEHEHVCVFEDVFNQSCTLQRFTAWCARMIWDDTVRVCACMWHAPRTPLGSYSVTWMLSTPYIHTRMHTSQSWGYTHRHTQKRH
jgi:hypothetical protein